MRIAAPTPAEPIAAEPSTTQPPSNFPELAPKFCEGPLVSYSVEMLQIYGLYKIWPNTALGEAGGKIPKSEQYYPPGRSPDKSPEDAQQLLKNDSP